MLNKCVTAEISSANGVISTIGKHVIAQDALAGGNEGIGVDEAGDFGIIITALQVIEAGISSGGLAKRPLGSSVWIAKCYPHCSRIIKMAS